MTYIDNFLRVSSAQVVSATAVSTNSIDLSTIEREMGTGTPLYFQIAVVQSAAAVGAATVTFQVVVGDTGSPLSGNLLVIGSTDAISKDDLVAAGSAAVGSIPPGTIITVPINPNYHDVIGPFSDANRKFLGLNYVVATGPLTAGQFTADLVCGIMGDRKFYASGYSVS